MITRPMLAVDVEDLSKLKYPVIVSPKLDGIRCVKVNGKALSRSFKPIPNHHIRNWIEANVPDGADGEILAGNSFQDCQSMIMTRDGTPEFTFNAFDYVRDGLLTPFEERFGQLLLINDLKEDNSFKVVEHFRVHNEQELLEAEDKWLSEGFEGVMIRDPNGPYKCGRSTLKEGYLLKLKRFTDSEAIVTGFEELLHNDNPKKKNELGLTKRSSHKDNMRPAGTLGVILAKDLTTNKEIRIGSGEGLTKAFRQCIWNNQETYLGQIVKYKWFQPGTLDLPRILTFVGFRDKEDM